jgi:hypothetical protein
LGSSSTVLSVKVQKVAKIAVIDHFIVPLSALFIEFPCVINEKA